MRVGEIRHVGRKQRLEYRFNNISTEEMHQLTFADLLAKGGIIDLRTINMDELSIMAGLFAVEHRERKDAESRRLLEIAKKKAEKTTG